MAEVSSVVLNYAVRGADRAQRKDKQVRESVKRTGREARKQAGTINRWMQRHQAAIAGIAAATAGAMMAIIKNSPTLSGELAGLRLSFSLFAMTVGEDVAPALNGASEAALDLQESYANLPAVIRKPISALIGFSLAAGFVAATLATLETVIGGTVVAGALGTLAAGAKAAGAALLGLVSSTAAVVAAIVGLLAVGGLVVSELLGITDATNMISESQNRLVRAASNLLFFFLGPFLAAFAVIWAAWTGGWSNAKRVALRFIDEIGKAFIRFMVGLSTGIGSLTAIVVTGFEAMWALAVNATKAGVNLLIAGTEAGINKVMQLSLHARERVPVLFDALWSKAKQHTADGMNDMISRVESGVNRMITALNKLPEVDIGKVSLGRVSAGGGVDTAQRMRGARRRAQSAFQRRRMSFGRLDTKGAGEIAAGAKSRLKRRFKMLRQREQALKKRFAREAISIEPPKQQAPDSGPAPSSSEQQKVDNSVTFEQFVVEQRSTGDAELDGEKAGRAAIQKIEEERAKRR